MWQRIQTVYMAVVVILFGVMLSSPLIDFTGAGASYVLNYAGIVSTKDLTVVLQNTVFLTVIEVIIALVALVSLFLYKKRILQIRLCIINIVLMLGYYALLFLYVYIAVTANKLDYKVNISLVFPLVSAILTYLAVRAIGRDEELVRSLNRVR